MRKLDNSNFFMMGYKLNKVIKERSWFIIDKKGRPYRAKKVNRLGNNMAKKCITITK